jgi:hypothetical protein
MLRVAACEPATPEVLEASRDSIAGRDDLNHTSDWHIDAVLDRLARIGAFRDEVGGGRR